MQAQTYLAAMVDQSSPQTINDGQPLNTLQASVMLLGLLVMYGVTMFGFSLLLVVIFQLLRAL